MRANHLSSISYQFFNIFKPINDLVIDNLLIYIHSTFLLPQSYWQGLEGLLVTKHLFFLSPIIF